MSQPPYPPTMPYSDPGMMPMRRGNGWAVASLICGLLGCIPVSQLLAIVFGIVGVRRANVVQNGKGMAIAGIILGVLFTLGWAGCGGTAAVFWIKGQPVRAKTHQFLQDAAAGSTDKALAQCTSGVTAAEINSFAADMAPHGAIKDITAIGLNVHSDMSGTQWEVVGVITFADQHTQTNQLTLTKVADEYKVTKFVPQNVTMPTAAPAATMTSQPSQTP